MKSKWYEALRLYGAMYPEKLETVTEKEFRIIREQEIRRKEDGNFGDDGMYCQCSGVVRI